ncbi:hypothetical protein [Nonomuraea sp. KM90]|uniref:hypothetical protein n=1 Tax=Nonomuraea sp. KM90 TaxID=3457428 RepID=UPI003FCC77F1
MSLTENANLLAVVRHTAARTHNTGDIAGPGDEPGAQIRKAAREIIMTRPR